MSPRSLSLALNPSARISIDEREQPPSFLVEAPIKGASFSSVRVDAGNLPAAHAFLCSILIEGNKDALIGERDALELRQIGLFAPADSLPQAVHYQFPLRAPPPGCIPRARSDISDAGDGPDHLLTLRLPEDWPEQALRFEPHHHASVWAPVRVSREVEAYERLDRRRNESRPATTTLDSAVTRTHFEREGFTVLENLLPGDHVEELGRYFQALAAQGFLSCSEDRGSRRYIAHNHPVANFWHDQLNERVSQLAGRPTKRSYSFASLYLAGGDLFWHTDRPPCEYTVTLLLDYAPLDADRRSPWALKVKGRDGTIHTLHQRIGEALLFKGRELRHGRAMLPDGHRSASLLFHFVNEDYDGVME